MGIFCLVAQCGWKGGLRHLAGESQRCLWSYHSKVASLGPHGGELFDYHTAIQRTCKVTCSRQQPAQAHEFAWMVQDGGDETSVGAVRSLKIGDQTLFERLVALDDEEHTL